MTNEETMWKVAKSYGFYRLNLGGKSNDKELLQGNLRTDDQKER